MSDRIRIQQQKQISDNYSYPQLAQTTGNLRMGTAQASVNHDISRISLCPQARLTVSQPGDFYEQEADRVAKQVMGMSDRANHNAVQREANPQKEENLQLKSLGNTITPLVQREEIPEEEEEESLQMKSSSNLTIQREEMPEEEKEEEEENLQMKSLGNLAIQRKEIPEEEEELVQAKPSLQRFDDGGLAASSDISSKLHSRKGQGSPLADDVRNFMEPRFGVDFSNIKVHTDSDAVQMSRELGAQAFTYGSDVYFGLGKSPGNNELTAHELTHVVQQGGAVQIQQDGFKGQLMREDDGNPLPTDIKDANATSMGTGSGNSTTNFSVSNKTRAVSGKTLSQVWDDMTNSGTKESASVLPELKPDPQYGYDENEKVTKVTVNVKETKEMPQWIELEQQCQPIKNEWNRFYSALDRHEERHVSIDRKHYTNVHQKLVGKPRQTAWDTLDEVVDVADKENKAYDTSSNHGIAEGSKINAAVQCDVEKLNEPGTSPLENAGITSDIPSTDSTMLMAKRTGHSHPSSFPQLYRGHDFNKIFFYPKQERTSLPEPSTDNYLPSLIIRRDETTSPPAAPPASETPGKHENQRVGTWGVWSKTPLTTGKRDKEDFRTREAAIAYAKGMGKAAAVFQEDNKFIVYPVSYSSLIYSFTYSSTRMFNNSNISDVMGVAGVLALITEDGTAILPHQYGGEADYNSWMEQQNALKPGENPFDAHKEAFGEGLGKIAGKEKFLRQFELAMRDTASGMLDRAQQEAKTKQQEVAEGLPTKDAKIIHKAAKELEEVDKQLIDWKAKQSNLNAVVEDPVPFNEEFNDRAKREREEASKQVAELELQRKTILLDYPLLSQINPAEFNKLNDADRAKMLGGASGQVLKDIEETRKNVTSGNLNLWALDLIVKSSLAGLSITDPERQNWAKDKAKLEKKIDTAISIALGVLQIGFSIAATTVGGPVGVAFAIGAGVTGVADATRMTNKYFQNKAAANTDINKDKALVPQDIEDQWAWLVVAWVGVGLSYADAIEAARAVKAGAGAAEVIASESSKLAKASGVEESVILKAAGQAGKTPPDPTALRKLLLSALPDEKMVAKFKDIPVNVLTPEDFIKRFGSTSGEAVTTFKQGKDGELIAEVFFKETSNPLAMREEAVHIAQAADKEIGAKLAKLSESNFSSWSKMETEQQLELYKTKIEVEIDAQQRLLRQFAGEDPQYLVNIEGNLKNLQSRIGEVEQAIKDPNLIKQGKMPWWDSKQPPRLFAKALSANSIIIDSNTAIALNKYLKGEKLQPGEEALIKQLETMGDADLRLAEQVVGEVRNGIIRFQGIVLTIDRSSTEYQKLLQVLEQANVGGGKGAAARQIVADVFFAKTEPGVVPAYTTHDPGQYNKFYKIKFGIDPHPRNPDLNGKSLVEVYKDKGFDVTINGKTIHVIPLPNK
ncbi:DUF4157 domain-containing protein [Scytonema sp. NUACC26]|uniref:eCIS core domain-containing protein n=1 Tax=Scytonema sp. NUACC26 TaxID=3140176 RepID=UPI0034DC4402